MRILINATSARMGGALTYLERLIRELDARPRGHEITIVVRQGVVDCAAKNIRLAIVDASICESPIRIFLWQQITLPILLWKEKFDLLYSTANFATFFSPCPQILLVRIPLYFSELYKTHILRKKSLSSRLTFTLRSLLISASQKIATHTLFPTASLQQDFFTPKPVDSVRTSINWYGTDPSAFSNTVPLRTPVRILCTSHYSDYKTTPLLEGLLRLKTRLLAVLLTATIDPSLPLQNGSNRQPRPRPYEGSGRLAECVGTPPTPATAGTLRGCEYFRLAFACRVVRPPTH